MGFFSEKGSSESEDETPKRHMDSSSHEQRSGWRDRDAENEDCSSEAYAEQGKYCTLTDEILLIML